MRAPFSILAFTLWLSLVVASAGCTTTKTAGDDRDVALQQSLVRPGAEGWQRHALMLPADAPVVFWARSDALFDSLGGFRDWLFAEPAMFGPNGEQMIAQAKSEWNTVIATLGMDPLDAAGWQALGLETGEDVYLGIYPVEEGRGEAFISAFEGAVREALELEDDTSLLVALDTAAMLARSQLPRGLHKAVASAAREHEPILGVRLVVPVADRAALLENIDRLMRGAEYVQVDEGEFEGHRRIFFYDLGAQWPAILLRAGEDVAIFDILSRRAGPAMATAGTAGTKAAVDALRERLEGAVAQVQSGRPAAPKPAGTPIVGVAVDQAGAARLAKLRGYRTALERADVSALTERDALFLQDVHSTLKSSKVWDVAAGNLSGVSYGLFAGDETNGFFRVGVTLFGERGDRALSVSSAPMSLGVDKRGMGLSLDLLPLEDAAWQNFIGVADPGDVVDNFTAADYDPSFFALSFPRSLAVLFANSEKLLDEYAPESLETLPSGSEALRRLEIASVGIDMRGLRIEPRLVGLVLLDENVALEKREELAKLVGEVLRDREDRAKIFFHSDVRAEAPYLFFSYGLDDEVRERELAGLANSAEDSESEEAPRTFFARAEPVALLSLVTLFEPDLFEPIDVSILAQRVGALVFSVEPEAFDGVQTIRYDFRLERPPSLDGSGPQ